MTVRLLLWEYIEDDIRLAEKGRSEWFDFNVTIAKHVVAELKRLAEIDAAASSDNVEQKP